MANALEVKNVSQAFGAKKILGNVNLTIPQGQFVSLVGPSGCGKSTLLRAILGTHPPMQGEIFAEGKKITAPSRNVGIVYQHYSLYDFMTAQKNVAFGLTQDQTNGFYRTFGYCFDWLDVRRFLLKDTETGRLNRFANQIFGWRRLRRQHIEQAKDMLEKVGLGASIGHYPAEMSGGMKQRVAIAQALIMQPKVLLLDEPFGALDEATREELQDMIVCLYNENKAAKAKGETPPYTIVIVTHELNEAIYLSDRVIGLSQYHSDGTNGATIVYDKPATAFDRASERDYSSFVHQKEELRNVVFNTESKLHASEHCIWKEV